VVFDVAEIWTLRPVNQKYLEGFEILCWRRMEKIMWNDRVRKELLRESQANGNVLYTIKRRKANRIGHILPSNCLIKHVIEGKTKERIQVTEIRGRRFKQLLDDIKKTRRC